jgi:hypothetical protein
MKFVHRFSTLLALLMALPLGLLRAADMPVDFDRSRQILADKLLKCFMRDVTTKTWFVMN